jgi:hypothetical protein
MVLLDRFLLIQFSAKQAAEDADLAWTAPEHHRS